MLLNRARLVGRTAMKSPTINRVVSKNRSMLMVYAGRRGLSELLSIGKGGDDQSKQSTSKRAPVEPGTVSPPRPVPASILCPPYANSGRMPDWDERPQYHDASELVNMRAACRLAAQVLDHAGTLVRPGVTTDEIDKAVHDMIIAADAYPSPLNYGGFPKSVCTSVNEVICHGIPDSRPLKEGDIVNIDVTVYLNGYHGDTSRMFAVGQISDTAARLCTATTEALMAGIQACGPGVRFASIGNAIQQVADSYKFSLSRTFVGHGVGRVFHSYPHILHHRNSQPGRMEPGMTFTIEPMLCEGSAKEKFWSDQWTAVTIDGGLSAQQEHTLLITDTGVEILTVSQ